MITVLIAIIWVLYGVYAVRQSEGLAEYQHDPSFYWVLYIAFAPLVFLCKAIYGAFKRYDN